MTKDITYDEQADMWYVPTQNESPTHRTVSTDANIDLDEDGNIVGIELFGWSNRPE